MAKKQEVDANLQDLKTKIQADKVVIGVDRVMKGLRAKTINKVFLASNCPTKMKEDIYHYAKLIDLPVVELGLDNEELGLFCKKNFMVAVIGAVE